MRRPPAAVLALIPILAALFAFAHTPRQSFVNWDDDLHITGNPHLALPAERDWRYFWRHPYQNLYVPLPYTFWYALSHFARRATPPAGPAPAPAGNNPGANQNSPFSPAPFHTANLLLHLANTALIFCLLLALLRAAPPGAASPGPAPQTHSAPPPPMDNLAFGSALGAALGATLWAVHPLQVESVAWVSEARGLLCSFFSLLAILGTLPGGATRRRSALNLALMPVAFIAFVLALLAKPAAVAVPLLALTIHCWWPRPESEPGLGPALRARLMSGLRRFWPWFVLSVLWVGITRYAQPTAASGIVSHWWTRPLVAADALAFYLGKLLLPAGLGIDYGRTPAAVIAHGWAYFSWLAPALLFYGLWRWRRWVPVAWLGALLWFIALLPVLGLVTFVFQAYSTVADRYMYLAMLGPALLLGRLVQRVGTRARPAWWGLVALYLLLLMALTVRQTATWDNSETLMRQALRVNPHSAVAHDFLGVALANSGRSDAAMTQYRLALADYPTDYLALNNLGQLLEARGAHAAAEAMYRRALLQRPHYYIALANLGRALARRGQWAQTLQLLQASVAANRHYAPAQAALGSALARNGRLDEAIDHLGRALQLDPGDTESSANLGLALYKLQRYQDSLAYLPGAAAAQPHNLDLAAALGLALAHSGKPAQSVAWLAQVAQARPKDAEARYNLGLALLLSDRKPAAAAELRAALRLDPSRVEARAALADAQKSGP